MELVTASIVLPVSLDEAKAHCRVEASNTEDNAQIEIFIEAAVNRMQMELDYALGEQVWRGSFDSFSCVAFRLRPFVGVEAVKYVDGVGVEQTLDPAAYRVRRRIDGVVLEPVGSWPNATSVTVDFKAGSTDIPPALKAALLLHIGFLYAGRESSSDTSIRPTGAYDELTWPFNMSLM